MSRFLSHKRTYAEAVEELGGMPWRSLEGTEQWFLVDEEAPPKPEPDTDAFRIPRPSNKWWMAIGAALISGGLFALLVGSAVATPAPPAPPPRQQVYVLTAPVAGAAPAALGAPVAVAVVAAPVAVAAAPVAVAAPAVAVAAPAKRVVVRRHLKRRKRR